MSELQWSNLQTPDIAGNFQQGLAFGQQQRALKEQRADNDALRGLAPGVLAGDPGALAQAAAIDPQAAGQLDSVQSTIATRARGAAEYMLDAVKRGNPQEIQGRYQAVLPFLTRLGAGKGQVPPPQFDPAMVPAMEQLVAMGQGGASGVRVQSRYVTDNGDVVALMSDGSRLLTGDKADPRTAFRDQPGVAPGIVTMSGENRGQIAPVHSAGQPPQGVQMQSMPYVIDDPQNMPPQVVASIGQQEQAAGSRPWTQNTPNPYGSAMPSEGVAAPRPDYAGQASQRADEASARAARAEARAGIPAGYQRSADGSIEFMPGGPADPEVIARNNAAKPNAAATKEATARRAKIPQLQNAIRGMSRIDDALQALDRPGINTGPVDQYAVRYTEAGQELDAAVGGIQNSFLALTRVPGIGSQSDLEARVAALQYPSLNKSPEVNRRTMENLKLFARDLAQAYELAASEDAAAPRQAAPANQGAAGGGGQQSGVRAGHVEDGYRFKGGNPSDPNNWERL